DGLSTAHGIRNGVCDPCEGGNEQVLRRHGGVATEVYVVQQELPRKDVARGKPEAERLWFLRCARERVHLVSGEFQSVSLGGSRGIGRGQGGRAGGQQLDGPCIAWQFLRCCGVVRAVRQPYQQRADLPAVRLRFPFGEDYCTLTARLLRQPPA